MITGSIVALATPMKVNGDIDWEALRRLVNFHLDNGTDAIVAAGTTGEPTTMTFAEHFDVIRSVVEEVNGRIPVIAGTGSNNTTSEAVELDSLRQRSRGRLLSDRWLPTTISLLRKACISTLRR